MPYTPEQIARLKATDPAIVRQALERLSESDRIELMGVLKGEVAPSMAQMLPSHTVAPEMALSHVPGAPLPESIPPVQDPSAPPETTLTGVVGSVNRGLAPYAAGSIAGPAGVAAVGTAKLVGDPLTEGVNSLLDLMGVDPKYHQVSPSGALGMLMDKLGVYKPRTAVERIAQAGAETAGGGLGGAMLGQQMAKSTAPLVAGAGEILAAAPAQQVAGGAGAGLASQTAAELGGGPVAQIGAGLLGAALGSKAVPKPKTPLTEAYKLPELAPAESQVLPGIAGGAENPMGMIPKVQTPTVSPEEIGAIVKKAALGSKAAQQKLADLSSVNIEAKNAAERLGIDLPADVFSDNPMIREAAGLTRSVAGTPASGAWRTIVTDAVDKADEALGKVGASFVEGQVSPGMVSQKVKDSLLKTRSEMNVASKAVYEQVDSAIPKASKVELPNLGATLNSIKNEMGVGGLSAQEKKLLQMAGSKDGVTYGRLIREKNLVGQAIAGKDSPYGNMEAASLKRLYGALAEDQMTNVDKIGGPELKQQLQGANLLYGKERALGQSIVDTFGAEGEGSIANKMRAAITSSSKGASEDFNNLMKIVPDDLKKEVVATALGSVTRSARGAERGGFGFSEYAKTYQGLRANPPIYKQIVSTLGNEAHEMMRDLYEVSRVITDARANVLTTGKANQALVGSMQAEGLVSKVLDSAVAKGGATVAAGFGGGPVAAGATSLLTNALSAGKKDTMALAGKLFISDEFKRLAVEAASRPTPSNVSVRAVANSSAFRRFSKAVGIPNSDQERTAWILNALRGQQATTQPQEDQQ